MPTIDNLSAAELGWIIIFIGGFSAVGIFAIISIFADWTVMPILAAMKKIFGLFSSAPVVQQEEDEEDTVDEEVEVDDLVVYGLSRQNLKLEFQRINNLWLAYVLVGEHKSRLSIEPNESLKELMLKALLHLEIQPD